jgi:quercetin dioxygenase-like cupin family protein
LVEGLVVMKVKKITPSFEDERGKITDILVNEPIDHVNVISFKKNAVRGEHYHEKSLHFNYVLSGAIKFLIKPPNGVVESRIIAPGELVLIPPGDRHTLIALEDSELLVFTRGERGGENYEKDTYRLSRDESLSKEHYS